MPAKHFDSIEQHKSDFTTDQYVELLRLAKKSYEFVGYGGCKPAGKYVFWRHDVDLSLNRAIRLAQLEHDEGVRATYFLNPHCEFYNLFEKGQTQIVKHILSLGHDVGLHFDAGVYQIESEAALDKLIVREKELLQDWFGVRANVFSFHNPNVFMLSCEKEEYGGLINCYSKHFKTSVSYCSDSNGYWRFRRLRDVLEAATDSCLQVLTHPELWQETVLSPRERVFRCVYGRASKAILGYDQVLAEPGRINLGGAADNLKFLKDIDAAHFQLCDYLWNSRMLQSLLIELYRLHERQIRQLCKAILCRVWRVPKGEVDAFFEGGMIAVKGWQVFQVVCGISWVKASGGSDDDYQDLLKVCDQLFHESAHISPEKIEEGCVYLCRSIESVAQWGRANEEICYDGISHLDNLDEHVKKLGDEIDLPHLRKWEELKFRLQEIQNG